MLSRAFLLLFLVTAFFSCKSKVQKFDFGAITNDVYSNEYFNFSIDLPSSFNAQADGENEWKIGEGYIDIETNEVRDDIVADKRDVEDAILLVAIEKQPQNGVIPSSITWMAESLLYRDDVKTGAEYLDFSTQEIVEMGNFTLLSEAYEEILIGNQKFYMMDASLDVGEQEILQTFISTVKNQFGLSCILTYGIASKKSELIEVIKTMKF